MQLPKELIALDAKAADKCAAITLAAKLLSEQHKVQEAYLQGMLTRETQENTYLGNGVAIPHGIPETRHLVHETAIAVVQIPAGVSWGAAGEKVQLVVAIAANGDEHLQILRRLTRILNDEEKLHRLKTSQDPAEIQQILSTPPAENTPPVTPSFENPPPPSTKAQQAVVLPNPLGLHARPATRLSKLAQSLATPVYLRTKNGACADARRMMDLLSLGLEQGSNILIESDNADDARRVAEAITAGLGENLADDFDFECPKAPPAVDNGIPAELPDWDPPSNPPQTAIWIPQGDIKHIQGLPASDGLAFGVICHYEQYRYNISHSSKAPLDEAAALDWALTEAARGIYATRENISQRVNAEKAAVFNAHLALLNDETILNDTIARIAMGENAARAYKTVLDNRIAVFETQPSATLAARSADLRDVRERVLKLLLGIKECPPKFPPDTILCAKHLTPGNIAHLPAGEVFGIITAAGSPTDHNAIIARGMGLPTIVGVGADFDTLKDGDTVIMDGNTGNIFINPTPAQYESAKKAKEGMRVWQEQALMSRMEPGHTADGKKIDILANINHADVAGAALDTGAEGVGLMRTESLFLNTTALPSVKKQTAEYLAMSEALGDHPLFIRTLDVTPGKVPHYLGLQGAFHGALSCRGVRLALAHQEWFVPQLEAICQAACQVKNIHVMFPMVITFEDFRAAKALFDSVRQKVGAPPIPVGAIIETPAAALSAHHIASEADFFSIGTNNLSRYVLTSYDPQDALHPAVLQLIDMTVRAARLQQKPVGIYGGAAGDVLAAKIFVGLGAQSLSVRPSQIATIKQALRESHFAELVAHAHKALSLKDAQAVRLLFSN